MCPTEAVRSILASAASAADAGSLREQRGLTIEELAVRAQVGSRHVARVEAGRGSPSLLWLFAVAEGLAGHPSELLLDDQRT